MSEPGRSGRWRSARSAVSRPARVGDDDAHRRPAPPSLRRRMRLKAIGWQSAVLVPISEEAVGLLEVGRRRRAARRRPASAHSRRRPRPCTGVSWCRSCSVPQEALGELRREVVLLGGGAGPTRSSATASGPCAATISRSRSAAWRSAVAHGTRSRSRVAARAQLGMQQPVGVAKRRRQVDGLGADVAEVGGVVRIALHPADGAVPHLHEQAAADAAVRAERRARQPARLRRGHAPRPPGNRPPNRAARSSRAGPGWPRDGAGGRTGTSMICPMVAAGPLVMQHDAVGQQQRLVHVVGDHDHGLARVRSHSGDQLVLQLHPGERVEQRERLVEQEQARLQRERARDRPRAAASRPTARADSGSPRPPRPDRRQIALARSAATRGGPGRGRARTLSRTGQPRQQRRRLEDDAAIGPRPVDLAPADHHAAGRSGGRAP